MQRDGARLPFRITQASANIPTYRLPLQILDRLTTRSKRASLRHHRPCNIFSTRRTSISKFCLPETKSSLKSYRRKIRISSHRVSLTLAQEDRKHLEQTNQASSTPLSRTTLCFCQPQLLVVKSFN